ncbi:calponin homology domain-containing protein DDB_G0272472-like [Palaemon carinicauda]|uniref:calponin homology domain-containing protein DDB_G0272472-like n=1 Tax=Palaemon carinicauda TaxID=392227 RepID=UPI0035B64771
MTYIVNKAISQFMDIIGTLKGKLNWPQKADSALLEQNLACEDMTLELQGQLRALQESRIFKWFSWLLPEAPRFEDCPAVASQDGFLGRWLRRCPWVGGLWKARQELQRCELGLHQMEREALRFKDELKSTWFVGKLLPEFDLGQRMEESLSIGNRNYYSGMAAASVILGGIMLAWKRRRMAEEDVDNSSLEEYVPEMEHLGEDLSDGNVLEMETDQTTLLQNLKDENDELQGQIKEMGRIVEMNKKLQNEQVKELKNETEKDKLESECVGKDIQRKEHENLLEILRKENAEMKKEQIQNREQVNELKNEVGQLKTEKDKLESECVGKEIQRKDHENLLEILRKDNAEMKKEQIQNREQVNELKNEAEKTKLESECVQKELQKKKLENLLESLKKEKHSGNKWKREFEELKEEKEKLEANLVQDYEKLEFVCKIKDFEIMEQKMIAEKFERVNKEIKKAQSENTEQLNKLKSELCELKAEKKLEAEKEEERKTKNKDEHKRKSLLMAGLSAQMNNRPKEAVDIFTQALAVETDNDKGTALLHVLRAEANAATEKPPNIDIVLDCSMAIEKGCEGWKAYMLRGRYLVQLGIFDAALKDFETVKVKKNEKFSKIVEDTKALQKEWEDKGHYEVLGLEKTATKAEAIKSFRDLSMAFHPDRHRDKPEFLQEAFEEKYKKVVNAKLILVDERNRRDYDEELRHQEEYEHWEKSGGQWNRQEPGQWNHGRQYHQGHPRWEEHRQYSQRPRKEQHRQGNNH